MVSCAVVTVWSCIASGVVRGDVKLGGWVLKPNADDTACQATYLMLTDLCGDLPTFVVKKATSVQGKLVLTIRKVGGAVWSGF